MYTPERYTDIWTYGLIGITVVLRLLFFEKERPTIKGAFSATLAAFLVAMTCTDPALDWIPSDDPEKYRDALIVAFALTGGELLRALIFFARNPHKVVQFVYDLIMRKKD